MMENKPKVLVTGIHGNYGGTEAVVSRFISALSDDIQFDSFCYQLPKQEIFSSGDNKVILAIKRREHPIKYYTDYSSFFRLHAKEYSAIWYHGNQFSNIEPLKLAHKYGIPNRIMHYHSTTIHGDYLTKMLSAINRREVIKTTTVRLACSDEAGRFAYAGASFNVLHNAFDISEFAFNQQIRDEVREEFSLSDSFVIGTVGRLSPEKNQHFLVRCFPDVLRCRPDARLVIVGDGDLRSSLDQCVRDCGLEDKVILTGARADISRILNAFDVFAFPSLWEGLGISAVEAQANGLPCIISDTVPSLAVVSDSVIRLSLDCKSSWVEALCCASRNTFLPDESRIARFDINSESKHLSEFLLGDYSTTIEL